MWKLWALALSINVGYQDLMCMCLMVVRYGCPLAFMRLRGRKRLRKLSTLGSGSGCVSGWRECVMLGYLCVWGYRECRIRTGLEGPMFWIVSIDCLLQRHWRGQERVGPARRLPSESRRSFESSCTNSGSLDRT
ncbi:uncharacterized protein LY89DRAFT_715816 [Mollisia scopiformis]|uniref:Uncharacterized protein n=1 Tax=Mollisia scopiformis TaxID=149040 RepID=A0A194XJX0_MOLSC|nr:uncharacterized protein LY89DRAFT_715816 [Mollisia scopiformis]KUJ20409.1 hypothetical protein LY89DRAFT_715816 [Mollisia scopiformis]